MLSLMRADPLSRTAAVAACTQQPATISSSQSGRDVAVAWSSAAAGRRRCGRRAGWRRPASATGTSAPPQTVTPPMHDLLAGDRRPRRCRRSRRRGRRRPTRAASPRPSRAVTSSGAARPGHGRGGDERVGVGDVRREQLALAGGAVLGHLAGVAAGALERLEVELDERRAHRAHLVGGGGRARRTPRRPRRAAWPWRSPAARRHPAPSTSTLAGGTVPAAVMSSGKNAGSRSAATSAAR